MIRVLLVDDDLLDRKTVARALGALGDGYELSEAEDGSRGIELALTSAFDCVLLDYDMPGANGLDMLERLHGGKNLATPVIMLTGNGSESVAVEAMKRGACDYLRKENLGPESLFRVFCNAVEKSALRKKLEEAQQKLETLALYDTLTGLGNRNLFQIELARAIAVAQRKNTSFMVLMRDLDNFKMANDTFGHEAGDAILAEIGCRLRNARAGDACFRLGGDEFTAILEAGSDGAAMARRIRTAVARPVLFGSHSLTVGISIGSAAYPADGSDADDLVRAADNAMYDDKNSGRPSAPGAAVAAA